MDEWRLLYGNPHRDLSIKSFGMFLQDAYRIKPRVILNLGLRYDVTFPIKDAHNQLANFIPSKGIVQVGDGISQPYPTRYNNVSPRVGVAWDIFGTGRTVLRAAGGLIFDQPSIRTFAFNGGGLNLNPSGIPGVTPGNGSITSFLVESFDGSQLGWDGGGPVFPRPPDNNAAGLRHATFSRVAPNLTTPYVANWNLNIQQALTPTTLLQVAYVANHGFNLYSVTDPNQADPTASANCILATGVAAGYPGASAIYGGDYSDCEQAAKPFTSNCAQRRGSMPAVRWIRKPVGQQRLLRLQLAPGDVYQALRARSLFAGGLYLGPRDRYLDQQRRLCLGRVSAGQPKLRQAIEATAISTFAIASPSP